MKQVLIVDDDPDLLEVVGLLIDSHGMKATCITTGKTLTDALEKTAFQLILMDIYLGDTDGRDLTRQIKDSALYQHIPVLLYSAGRIEPETIAQSGAEGFLKKPFEMKELITKIESLINKVASDQKN